MDRVPCQELMRPEIGRDFATTPSSPRIAAQLSLYSTNTDSRRPKPLDPAKNLYRRTRYSYVRLAFSASARCTSR
jgi:hypothetical protein